MSGRDLPADFVTVVEALKARVRETQLRAALAVNRELLGLYWNIGRAISERVEAEAWGTRVVEHLADELQRSFPGVAGFSMANVYRMRALSWAASQSRCCARATPRSLTRPPQSMSGSGRCRRRRVGRRADRGP